MTEIKGLLFTPDFDFKPGVLFIKGHTIEDVKYFDISNLSQEEKGKFVIPGLIDIHLHGAAGVDVCTASEEELKSFLEYEKSKGITSVCPATMTIALEQLKNALANLGSMEDTAIKGIYLEGPFISKKYKGAQDAEYIRNPDINIIKELNDAANGKIRIVTLAPEVNGAMQMLKEGKETFTFSIAHSDAGYEIAKLAFESGVTQVTHLYNGMPVYHHREPAIVGAAMDNDKVMVELIADGIHIHPSVLKNTFSIFGEDRVILISDSMEATGLANGEYTLAGQRVFVENKRAMLEDGTIAGSVTNLYDAMRNAISFGVRPEAAIRAVTYNPAKAIGISDRTGQLKRGMDADILILNKKYELIRAIY